MYYIGIDGGGNYSKLLALDENMKIIGHHGGRSINLMLNSYPTVLENARTLLGEFNALTSTTLDNCGGICIGLHDYDVSEITEEMKLIFKEIGLKCPVYIASDGELILATEAKGEPGIVIISGTSSMGFSVSEDRRVGRVGGWGYLLDDVGSGYWIGMQAVKACLYEKDGRGPATTLTPQIEKHFKVKSIEDVVDFIYSDEFNKSTLSEIALLVKYAAIEKDQVAIEIEERAAMELFSIADALIKKSGLTQHKIVLSGNVILLNERIKEIFSIKIKEKYSAMEVISVKEKPELGAVYLAMSLE